jgi:hypothetical protein
MPADRDACRTNSVYTVILADSCLFYLHAEAASASNASHGFGMNWFAYLLPHWVLGSSGVVWAYSPYGGLSTMSWSMVPWKVSYLRSWR